MVSWAGVLSDISWSETHVDEIDKRIPHADEDGIVVSDDYLLMPRGRHLLAVIGKVDSQIHEVVLPPTRFVDDALEHGLVNLIRNVPKHDLEKDLDWSHC